MSPRHSVRGYSLMEIMIVLAITAVVLAAVYAVITSVIQSDDRHRARIEMQLEAAETMRKVVEWVKHSGPAELTASTDGIWQTGEYPIFATDATGFPAGTDYGYLVTGNSQITPVSPVGDSLGYGGTSNEMAFRLPRDNDYGDGKPKTASAGGHDLDVIPTTPTGEIEWGEDTNPVKPIYYALVVSQGIHASTRAGNPVDNELQIRSYNSDKELIQTQVLATGVERLRLEMAPPASDRFYVCTAGDTDPSLGIHQLRITIWFLKLDPDGRQVRLTQQTSVNFRSIQR